MGNKAKSFSIIDKGLTIDGTVTCNGRLIIKGTVQGVLEGETIVIAEEGNVTAKTKAVSLTVGGKFDGEAHVSGELILLPSGICAGKILCQNLVVEAGGVLNAEVSCIVPQQKVEERIA